MPLFGNALAGAAGSGGADAFSIQRSLRFNSGDSAYLSRTPSSAGNGRTWTYSCWVKRTTIGAGSPRMFGNYYGGGYQGWDIAFSSSDKIDIHYDTGGGNYIFRRVTTQVFRDPSAWYHIVVAVDTTNATANDRVKLYVNGEQITAFDTNNNAAQNTNTTINTAVEHRIGYNYSYSDFYLAEVHFVDGQALAASDFGEFDATTGAWKPIEFAGNYNASGSGTMYSGMLTSSSGYYDSSHTAEKAFDGDLNTGAWNVNNYDNYMEFTPTTPINFTNGVQVYCYAANGYNITNYWSVDLDGNGLGSETTFVGGSANFNGFAWISVATGSGTLHKLRIRLTRSGSGSGVEIRAIAINGSGSSSNYLVDGTPSGTNGFHLDFDPDAADDYSGGGTFTGNTAGTSTTPIDLANAFDGDITTYALHNSAVQISPNTNIVLNYVFPGSGVDVSSSLRVYVGSYSHVSVNGGSTEYSYSSTSGGEWIDISAAISGSNFKLTSLNIRRSIPATGSYRAALAAVEVDGKILVDGVAPGVDASGSENHWTAKNLSAKSNGWPESVFAGNATYNINETSKAFYTGTGADLFDGTTNNYVGAQNISEAWLYFRPATAITGVTSLELHGAYNGGGTRVNGSDVSVSPSWTTSDQWVTISNPPSSISSIAVRGSAGAAGRLKAIKVNGTILTDVPVQDIDSLLDSPTNYDDGTNIGGNFCVQNPLNKRSNHTLSNGNLESGTTTATSACLGTMAYPKTGKWYYEAVFSSTPGYNHIGIATANASSIIGTAQPGYDTTNEFTYWQNGSKTNNVSYAASFTGGDVIGVAFDADAGSLTFYKNGVSQGVNSTGLTGTYFPFIPGYPGYTTTVNFGQRPWSYPVSGYKALCTQNFDTPLIADPSTAFDAVTYTSDGQASKKLTFGFSPDLFWSKVRNFAEHHVLHDSVRGPSKVLKPSSSAAESTESSGRGVLSFDSDGVTIGIGSPYNSSGNNSVVWGWSAGANSNKTYTVKVVSDSGNKYRFDDFGTSAVTLDLEEGSTYVFDQSDSSNSGHPLRFSTTSNGTHGGGSEYTTGVTATGTPGSAGAKTTIVVASGAPVLHYYCSAHSGMGGQANTNSTAGASNFDGTIQSTVKASQKAGVSIVSYTGSGSADSVGHNLNTTPSLVICKDRSSEYWVVWFEGFNSNEYLYLNGTDAKASWSGTWGSTPTNSVFGVSDQAVNQSSNNFIAYCFAPVEGFSSFGSYVGNGSANGPFVHTTHSVAFLLIKRTNSTGSWVIVDNKRDGYNETYKWLEPNTATAEQSITPVANVDFLSNGFKLRGNGATTNASGGAYMYWAIAENPFQVNGGLAR